MNFIHLSLFVICIKCYVCFFQLLEENEQLRHQLQEAQELARRQSDR